MSRNNPEQNYPSVKIKVARQAQKIPAINTSIVVLARNLMLLRPFRKILHRTSLIAVAKSPYHAI
jgi:hypothetical protein